MMDRTKTRHCEDCGVELAVGKRGPLAETCKECRELPEVIRRFFKAVSGRCEKLPPLGQARLRRRVMSLVMGELNATFNRHKFLLGKVTDATARREKARAS